MEPTVIIAYKFGDIQAEEEVLQAINATVLRVENLDTPDVLKRVTQADVVITNNGDLVQLDMRVRQAWQEHVEIGS